jgi:putative ABC transport system permease protein
VESVIVTAVFGYVGMVGGIGLTELISYLMSQGGGGSGSGGGPSIFRDPTVDLGIVLLSTGMLVVCGVLAGYFPARKAVEVSAVEAMRNE